MSFQLWSVDEYGQGSIIASGSDLEKITKIGKGEVHTINVENALTAEEKRKNWEAFFVEFDDESVMYAGKNPKGDHTAYLVDGEGEFEQVSIDDTDATVMIYLGELDGEPWYATDDIGNDIEDIESRFLNGKTAYFIKKI